MRAAQLQQLRRAQLGIVREPAPPVAASSGLSPFAARVLEQLSLTAWMPAVLLMTDVYVVIGLFLVRKPKTAPTTDNLRHVVQALDTRPIGISLAVFFGLLVTTILTQSLELPAIRFLEGYWGGSIAAAIPTRFGIWTQQRRQRLLVRRGRKLDMKAFAGAADDIRYHLRNEPVLAFAVDWIGRGCALPADMDAAVVTRARRYVRSKTWMPLSPAHLRHRAIAIDNKAKAFPAASRMMPTRLGNTMRVSESNLPRADVAGARMRGYVTRNLANVDPILLAEHDRHRNRLDMCAVMTPLALTVAGLDAGLLPRVLPVGVTLGFVGGFAVVAWLSYRGAIAAAIDYGDALEAINVALEGSPQGRRLGP